MRFGLRLAIPMCRTPPWRAGTMTLPEVEMRSVKAGVLALSLFAVGCSDRTSPTSETTGLEGIDGADEMTAPDAAAPLELGSAASTSAGGKVFGVDTENNLVVFNLDRPGRMNRKVRITGIGGQKIVGIDFRPSAVAPATAGVIGKLYGITKTKIYEIDPGTGYASNGQSLTVPLVGVSFGTGFNPTVDRLRSHGNATQNVRLSVDNGLATQDTALAYAVGDPGFGTAPSIGGTAYTNSDNDPATGTVLYAIEAPPLMLLHYNEVDPDLDGDGDVDGADLDIERRLTVWRQESPGGVFRRLESTVDLDLDGVGTSLTGLSRYAISY
jgi:hypothetical protein